MVIQDALEVLRLQPGHKFYLLVHLSTEVCWHHYDTIKELQKKQKAKSKVFYECKKQLIQLHLKAAKCVEEQISPLQETLVPISYKA
jgi:large subunit ribosomal protein L13Ae